MLDQHVQHPSTLLPGSNSGRLVSSVVDHDDDAQIEEIIDRLERRYTREQISSADLNSRVRRSYREFSTARIRKFVSIFVERLVRRSIEYPTSNP